MNAADVLKELCVRAGLRSERYFVGRNTLLSSLRDRMTPPFNSVWLHGPRRIGKSSLAWRAGEFARSAGAEVLEVDAIDKTTLDSVLQEALELAGDNHGSKGATVEPRDAFRELAKRRAATGLVVVFDEFDRVAVNLGTPDQGYLRKLTCAPNLKVGFVFVTRNEPRRIMEEVPDVSSRLAGVCKIHGVAPLTQPDVRELCRRVASDIQIDGVNEAADEIWKRVGGHTLACVAYLECAVRALSTGGELDDFALDSILDELEADIVPDFRDYVRSLHLASRLVAAGRLLPAGASNELRKDLLLGRTGAYEGSQLLGRVAAEVSESAALPSSTTLPQLRILTLVGDINEALQLQNKLPAFRVGSIHLRFYELLREPCTKETFEGSLSFLYKVFFECARSNEPGTDGVKRYLLPEPLAERYRRSAVIGAISDLRNFVDHEHSRATDTERPNKAYKEAGELLMQYCGQPAMTCDADRERVRTRLVKELETLLQSIFEAISAELRVGS